jgi:hypothetical protein
MKKWFISLLIGTITGVLMFLIFFYIIYPIGYHVDKTPITILEGIKMSILVLVFGTLIARIALSKNKGNDDTNLSNMVNF